MIIGLNAQKLTTPNFAGPEFYTLSVYKAFSSVDNENIYEVYFQKNPSEQLWNEISGNNPNFTKIVINHKNFWTQIGLSKYLLQNPADIFFTPVHTLPYLRNKKVKYIPMIHGLEHTYTKGFKNIFKKLSIERPVKHACEKADHIIAPSLATKNAILKKKWSEDKNISIVHEGIDESFYKSSEEEIDRIREKYGLDKKQYLFFISTIQPRKNVERMVQAYSLFVKKNPKFENALLVIAGKSGWDYEDSLNSPAKYNVENNVRFIGRIDDEDRAPLMSGSIGFVNLSLEEGFGLPLIEAMACETICLVSDIPAFREVGKDIPIFVDPYDIKAISEAYRDIFSLSEDEKKDFVHRGKTRSNEFSWEKTAQNTLRVFEKVLENR